MGAFSGAANSRPGVDDVTIEYNGNQLRNKAGAIKTVYRTRASGAAIGAGATNYFGPFGVGTQNATETSVSCAVAEATVLRAARIHIATNTATGAGSCTLRVNASSTNMPTIAIGAGATGTFELATNLPVSLSVGDLVAVQIITGTGGNTTPTIVEVEVDS